MNVRHVSPSVPSEGHVTSGASASLTSAGCQLRGLRLASITTCTAVALPPNAAASCSLLARGLPAHARGETSSVLTRPVTMLLQRLSTIRSRSSWVPYRWPAMASIAASGRCAPDGILVANASATSSLLLLLLRPTPSGVGPAIDRRVRSTFCRRATAAAAAAAMVRDPALGAACCYCTAAAACSPPRGPRNPPKKPPRLRAWCAAIARSMMCGN
mmetsp:Transcript_7960/g.24007  ORF Transcript_7960/g.24007 Transcript_7960/m.24007 type:complete len:215 (+) Transcript_7960:908-1552(+)